MCVCVRESTIAPTRRREEARDNRGRATEKKNRRRRRPVYCTVSVSVHAGCRGPPLLSQTLTLLFPPEDLTPTPSRPQPLKALPRWGTAGLTQANLALFSLKPCPRMARRPRSSRKASSVSGRTRTTARHRATASQVLSSSQPAMRI